MLSFILTSMMVASSNPVAPEAASMRGLPNRYCREMGSAASRSQAIIICRTRAQWQRWELCVGATSYCNPKQRKAEMGRESAFAMNEDSRIVCRRLSITGSRLAAQKACLPQREWERMWKDSAEAMLKMQDRSTRPEGPK